MLSSAADTQDNPLRPILDNGQGLLNHILHCLSQSNFFTAINTNQSFTTIIHEFFKLLISGEFLIKTTELAEMLDFIKTNIIYFTQTYNNVDAILAHDDSINIESTRILRKSSKRIY